MDYIEKLKEIKISIDRWIDNWEDNKEKNKEDIIDLRHLFSLHWRYIHLLEKMIDKEEQYREERYHLIEQYLKLISDKKEREKAREDK